MANNEKTFNWSGIDAGGQRKRGVMLACNIMQLKFELAKINITPISISEKKSLKFFSRSKNISAKHIMGFSQQLAKLNHAGIPLATAFDIIGSSSQHPAAKDLYAAMKKDLEKGNSLYIVLKKYPQYFDKLFCNLILAGEKSGTLETMLSYLADYQEKIFAQKSKIKKILFYPAVVMFFAIAITWALLIFVIPQFELMFANFGAVLPLYTRGIIVLAFFLKANGL